MRRKDREIKDTSDKLDVIAKCKVCRLGLSENNYPYIVPLNYGYSYENGQLTLFFHSAREGKKIGIMLQNDNACFEIDCDTQLIENERPCKFSYQYRSIIGFGKILFLETNAEKSAALNCIIKHQTEKGTVYYFTEDELNTISVFKMIVAEFTGKEKKQVSRDFGRDLAETHTDTN